MRIVVVGRGWTGLKVAQKLKELGANVYLSSHQLAHQKIRDHTPDHVVNCAGYTGIPNVDTCELHKPETYQANALFPISLYHLSRDLGATFSHFSSGCIYSGTIDSVDCAPNFFGSTYSISKGISDTYLTKNVSDALVFRIRMPFTGLDEAKNVLVKVRNYAHTSKLYDSGPNSLTDHDESIDVASRLILDRAPGQAYNLVNKGAITMRELADMMSLSADWWTESEFANATLARRSTCVIPSFHGMSDLHTALERRIKQLQGVS